MLESITDQSAGMAELLAAAIRHQQGGRLGDAEALYRRILAADPNHADALHLLGVIASQVGRNDVAVELISMAIGIDKTVASYHSNLGIALLALGRIEEAVVSCDAALRIKPDLAQAQSNRGNALRNLGRLEEALAAYDAAVRIQPNLAEAHSNRGSVLKDLGRLDEALASYDAALRIRPDRAEVHYDRANTLRDMAHLHEALIAYDQALLIRPDYHEAHFHRASTLKVLGRPAEALASYDAAIAIAPLAEYRFMQRLLLPTIVGSAEDIAHWRARYWAGVEELSALAEVLEDTSGVAPGSFELAYHNADDRPIMQALCGLFRARIPALNYRAPHIDSWRHPTGQRLRIGFCSQLLSAHTIGKLYQGFLRHLDRARFEVVIIHAAGAKRDEFRKLLDAACDRRVELAGKIADKQRQIAALELDVLFYPDIGMSPETYFLAYARLAPVQAVSYGHPDTTGIDTIDYFVGGDETLEPAGAEAHYSERLVRFSRLPFFYRPLISPADIPPRASLGLPETGRLYGCPQALFKLHPEFDAVLAAIAVGDPEGHIVMIDGLDSSWQEMLRARWSRSVPVLNERVIFVPRMSLEKFMALVAHTDVLLDPVHFGSGNTLYESMAYGKATVTWPGNFARGRFVYAAYRQMGLADIAPIAASMDQYAEVALDFARDTGRRVAFEERAVIAARNLLFSDDLAVREFEAFLSAALQATAEGQRLPTNWRPSPSRDNASTPGADSI